jgi:hypothetical protein
MRRRGQRSLGRNGLMGATFVLAFFSAPAAQATDLESLDGQCRSLLRRQVFDCTCIAHFLEAYLGVEQGEILVTLWALAVNENNQNQEILNLYLRLAAIPLTRR